MLFQPTFSEGPAPRFGRSASGQSRAASGTVAEGNLDAELTETILARSGMEHSVRISPDQAPCFTQSFSVSQAWADRPVECKAISTKSIRP